MWRLNNGEQACAQPETLLEKPRGPESCPGPRAPPPSTRPLRRCSRFKRFITSSAGSFKKTTKLIFLPVEKRGLGGRRKPSGQAPGPHLCPAPRWALWAAGRPTPRAGSGSQLHSSHREGLPRPPQGRGALRPGGGCARGPSTGFGTKVCEEPRLPGAATRACGRGSGAVAPRLTDRPHAHDCLGEKVPEQEVLLVSCSGRPSAASRP